MKKEVVEELEAMGSSLQHVSRAMPYVVPEGYFRELATSIEVETASGLAGSASQRQPYTVPEGYFDGLTENILSKTSRESQRKLFSFGFVRWAAAAILLICAGIAVSRLYLQGSDAGNYLAAVSDEDIQMYLSDELRIRKGGVVADTYCPDGLDTKDIIQYLDENGWGEEMVNENVF